MIARLDPAKKRAIISRWNHFRNAGCAMTQVRVLVLGSADDTVVRYEHLLTSGPVHLGPGLDVISADADSSGSRQLRLRQEGRAWFVDDSVSAHGTSVDGSPAGRRSVPVTPGAIIRTDDVVWTFASTETILLEHQRLLVSAPCGSALNYANHHCGAPIIGAIAARNFGDVQSPPTELVFQIDGYSEPWRLQIPPLAPATKSLFAGPSLRLFAGDLRRQVHPVRTQLRAELGAHQTLRDLWVLGFWDWSHDPQSRKSIAAFATPTDPAVAQLVADSHAVLKSLADFDRFEDLLRCARGDKEQVAVRSLYECLAERRDIHWMEPKVFALPGTEGMYQTVQSPHHILSSRGSEGCGDCLDLSLLLASCLSRLCLFPVLVFVGSQRDRPQHVFVGCWLGVAPGSRVLTEDAEFLRRAVAAGNLLVIECTGAADGVPGRPGKWSFAQAVADAQTQLAKAPWVCAVDIVGALERNDTRANDAPVHSIPPMAAPWDPEVEHAYDAAIRFAGYKRRNLESVCILFGLVSSGGQCVQRLLHRAGLNPAEAASRLDERVHPGRIEHEPLPGSNFTYCQHLAETYAEWRGAPCIQEQDLVWALIDMVPRSSNLQRALAHLGIDVAQATEIMGPAYSRPSLPTSARSL
jgi:hypothetical protein